MCLKWWEERKRRQQEEAQRQAAESAKRVEQWNRQVEQIVDLLKAKGLYPAPYAIYSIEEDEESFFIEYDGDMTVMKNLLVPTKLEKEAKFP